jgi:hypothetical protein
MIICFQLFLYIEMSCEMQIDDYENNIMILKDMLLYTVEH